MLTHFNLLLFGFTFFYVWLGVTVGVYTWGFDREYVCSSTALVFHAGRLCLLAPKSCVEYARAAIRMWCLLWIDGAVRACVRCVAWCGVLAHANGYFTGHHGRRVCFCSREHGVCEVHEKMNWKIVANWHDSDTALPISAYNRGKVVYSL